VRAPAPEPAPPVVLDRVALDAIVHRLAVEISTDHPNGVVLVGVLKGATIFLADLARAITTVDVVVDFLAISRYAPDSGRVRILKDLEIDVSGKDVIVVEDMVDTGLTLAFLLRYLQERAPRTVEVCTLLNRPVRRIVPLEPRYVGEEIPDMFALGYGLHFSDLYRNVPYVVEADRKLLGVQPDAYVDVLYRQGSAAGAGEADGRVLSDESEAP
jgi:hypoxanthine phosphoribosyltransferase